eukprot:15357591-Ditylum_brightwellii.AAC.1
MLGGNTELHTTDCCNKKNLISGLLDGQKKKHLDKAKKEEFCTMAKAFKKASGKGKKGHIITHLNQTLLQKRNDILLN